MSWHELHDRLETVGHIEHAIEMLEWDKLTLMPPGAAAARADADAWLKAELHERVTDPVVGDLIEAARAEDLDPWQAANVRGVERRWLRERTVPADLVVACARSVSACELAWRQARVGNDWSAVADKFGRVVALTRERAAAISSVLGCGRYDALLDEYEPGLSRAVVGPVFDDLRLALPSLIDAAIDCQPQPVIPQGPFPRNQQEALARELLARLGFDFTRGRLDTSSHPMTAGVPDDTRITTRYDDNWLFSFYAVPHEFGHGLYQQGLPALYRGQPVGAAAGVAMHEAQALLFEKQFGRSDAFLEFAAPILQRHLLGGVTDDLAWQPENLGRLVRNVARTAIRVDADEISYPLHVVLRYDLETALIDGELDAADLPQAWDEKMSEMLGVSTSGDYRRGCLQDPHWYVRMFSYFPTYTIGAIWAAQLYKAAGLGIPGLDSAIRVGKFDVLVEWLRTHVHRLGSLADSSLAMMDEVTGSKLDPDTFLHHLRVRYSP